MKFGLNVFKEDGTTVFNVVSGKTSSTTPVRVLDNGMLEIEIECEVGHQRVLLVPSTLLVMWWEIGEDE